MPDITTPIPNTDQLALLADAISDVGYWTWWAQNLPDVFQVEYAGTQLYFAPATSSDQPPSSRVALQFRQPTSICLLGRGAAEADFTWVERLQNDQLPPLTCSHDEFAFGDDALLASLLAQATHQRIVHGSKPTDDAFLFLREPYRLVAWCGDYGIALAAPALRILSHTGEILLEQVVTANQQWWSYWRLYWAKRSSPEALPQDYACEVTIPVHEAPADSENRR